MISVIVATYNQEKTIARTLEGILRQKCHEPIEILIGEDCSKDGTLKVCQEYAAKYPDIIRLFANNPNKGVLNNYFDCILAAKGEYLADCAGDDEWCDDLKLEKELKILEENKDVVLVHTDFNLRYAETNDIQPSVPLWYITNHSQRKEIITDGTEMIWHVLEHKERPAIHLCTALWRRSTMLEVYHKHTDFFRNKNYLLEDLQVCAFLSSKGKIAYLPEVTMHYEVSTQSISNDDRSEKMFKFAYSVASLIHNIAKTFEIDKEERMIPIYEYRLYPLAMHAFRSHNQELRHKAFALANQLLPTLNTELSTIKFITSNPFTWNLALLLRKAFVWAKRLK